MSNENEQQIGLSLYINALNEVLNTTIRRFIIAIVIISIVWGTVFGFFIYNAYFVDEDDYYNMKQTQPNQSQSFTKGVVTDGTINDTGGQT